MYKNLENWPGMMVCNKCKKALVTEAAALTLVEYELGIKWPKADALTVWHPECAPPGKPNHRDLWCWEYKLPTTKEAEMKVVKIVNFSYMLTGDQVREIESITGKRADVIDVSSEIDLSKPLPEQITKIVDAAGVDWANDDVVVNVPYLGIKAALIVEEIHRRRGKFPPLLQMYREEGREPKWHVLAILK